MKCVVCRKQTERHVCSNCWSNAIDRLRQFPKQYILLENEMSPTRGSGERVGGSKEPPIPVRLETLHLRSGGISKPLMSHEQQIRISQKHTRITHRGREFNKIELTVKYLTAQSDWIIAHYEAADDLTNLIFNISKRINSVLGHKSELMTIGTCPSILEGGDVCGARLQVNPTTLTSFGDIKCKACGTTWESNRWRLLGKVLDDANN